MGKSKRKINSLFSSEMHKKKNYLDWIAKLLGVFLTTLWCL